MPVTLAARGHPTSHHTGSVLQQPHLPTRQDPMTPTIDEPRRAIEPCPPMLPWWSAPAEPGSAGRSHACAPRVDLWGLVRLADSAFPADGFAQPGRLAEAHQAGRMRNVVDLSAFLEEALWEETTTVPYVRAARADPAVHADADVACEEALDDPLARSASREKGQAFLSGAALFSPATARLVADARRRQLAGHLAPAFGAVAGLLGAGDEDACRLFLYLGARGIVAEAVRLGIVGPLGGYAVLAAATPAIHAVLEHSPRRVRPVGAATGPALTS